MSAVVSAFPDVTCRECGRRGENFDVPWTHMKHNGVIVWSCPVCNTDKALDPRTKRHKRAAKRGGFQSRAGKLGTTKGGA